jgi:uncharacterized MAPEG superfamily protein
MPIFATVVLVATVAGLKTGVLDTLARTYLVARSASRSSRRAA